MRDVCSETRIRCNFYLCRSSNWWIQAALQKENKKETNTINNKALYSMMEEDRGDGTCKEECAINGRGIRIRLERDMEEIEKRTKVGAQIKRKEI